MIKISESVLKESAFHSSGLESVQIKIYDYQWICLKFETAKNVLDSKR